MEKRKIIFDTYDTAANGWTLAAWKLNDAVQKTNYVDKSCGDGSWDLSTAMTDGIPKYQDRALSVTLECSEGDRLFREDKIRVIINQLDGMRMDIVLPDDELHHVVGRLHVKREYNDLAHATVSVTAVCEPWKYSNDEMIVTATATATTQMMPLVNAGRRAVVPVLKVEGANASVQLTYGTATKTFSAGTYQWPDLLLTRGGHELKYSGSGTLTVTYREAVLE